MMVMPASLLDEQRSRWVSRNGEDVDAVVMRWPHWTVRQAALARFSTREQVMNDDRTVFVHPRQTDGIAVKPTVFRSLSEAREALRCATNFTKARIEIYVTDENLDKVLS